MQHDIKIFEATEATDEIFKGLQNLLPQLTTSQVMLKIKDLREIITSANTILFLARDSSVANKIVGSLTLVVNRIPSGLIASIEDVVVDREYRNKGIGEKLMYHAINRAKDLGLAKIDLTSHPSRAAANRLYQRLGFILRDTNAYRIVMI